MFWAATSARNKSMLPEHQDRIIAPVCSVYHIRVEQVPKMFHEGGDHIFPNIFKTKELLLLAYSSGSPLPQIKEHLHLAKLKCCRHISAHLKTFHIRRSGSRVPLMCLGKQLRGAARPHHRNWGGNTTAIHYVCRVYVNRPSNGFQGRK